MRSVLSSAHLSPLVDDADLDGKLLISNDPCSGVVVEKARCSCPTGPA
jgi:hypothetical protein